MLNKCPICGKVLYEEKCSNCGYRSIDDFVEYRTISRPAKPDLYVRQTCTTVAEQRHRNAQKTTADLNQNVGSNGEYHYSYWKANDSGEYHYSYGKANGTNNQSPKQETKRQSENENRKYSNDRAYNPNSFESSFDGNVNSERSQSKTAGSENSNAGKQAATQQKVNETAVKKYNFKPIASGRKCVLTIIIAFLVGAIWYDTSLNLCIFIDTLCCWAASCFFIKMVDKWDISVVLKILIDLVGSFVCLLLIVMLGLVVWE